MQTIPDRIYANVQSVHEGMFNLTAEYYYDLIIFAYKTNKYFIAPFQCVMNERCYSVLFVDHYYKFSARQFNALSEDLNIYAL